MATIVQSGGSSGTNNNTPSFNFSSNTTVGNYVVMIFVVKGITNATITGLGGQFDSGNNTYTQTILYTSGLNTIYVWIGKQTTTVLSSGGWGWLLAGGYTNQNWSYELLEISGITSPTADLATGLSGTSATSSINSSTPTAMDVVLSVVFTTAVAPTPFSYGDANFTHLAGQNGTLEVGKNLNWPAATATTDPVTTNGSVSGSWDEIVIAYSTIVAGVVLLPVSQPILVRHFHPQGRTRMN